MDKPKRTSSPRKYFGTPEQVREQKLAKRRAYTVANKARIAANHKAWVAMNRDKIRASRKRRLAANGDAIRAQKRISSVAYREKYRDRLRTESRERARAAYQADPESGALAAKLWRDSNPEKAKAVVKKWQSNNRSHLTAYSKALRSLHPERATKYRRTQISKDPEKFKRLEAARRRRYFLKYPGRHNDRRRRWRSANPDKSRLEKYRRRTLESSASGKFSMAELLSRIEFYGWACKYCRYPLTMKTVTIDHQIPLSRGGSNWPSNIAPACRSCNCRKRNKTPKEYVEYLRHHRFASGPLIADKNAATAKASGIQPCSVPVADVVVQPRA